MNLPEDRALLARIVLTSVPPLVRESIFADPSFRQSFDVTPDFVMRLNDTGLSVHRSALHRAIREVLSGATAKKLVGADGRKWKIKCVGDKRQSPVVALVRGKLQYFLPAGYIALSADSAVRLRFLDAAASTINLPSDVAGSWRLILAEHVPGDDELDELLEDLSDTPIEKARALRQEAMRGELSGATLVPRSRRYFERLVGAYDASPSTRAYAIRGAREHLMQLTSWRPSEGLLYSLLLAAHSSLTCEVRVDDIENAVLLEVLRTIEERGDPMSQVGAIEVGLRVLPARPEIEPLLTAIVGRVVDDDKWKEPLELLSALFQFVDGELSRIGLLREAPPFYRRLAAFAQAALGYRVLANSAIDTGRLRRWLLENGGLQCGLQSWTDMRLEPRWEAQLATPLNLRAEFLGRVVMAGSRFERNIGDGSLKEALEGLRQSTLMPSNEYSHGVFVPGPLEGGDDGRVTLPKVIAEQVRARLSEERVELISYGVVASTAVLFKIETDEVELVAEALRRSRYQLFGVESGVQLFSVLKGLAKLAAVCRNLVLGDEVRTLVRKYRRDPQFPLSVREAIEILLIAAASREDSGLWREFVGDALIELAFGDLEEDAGILLQSCVQRLCHITPELWAHCGRADAALAAHLG